MADHVLAIDQGTTSTRAIVFDASGTVVSVAQRGPNELLVVAENAGSATPRINDAIEQAGGAVESSREYRPTFDEVFAALVTQHAEYKRQAEGMSAAQAPEMQA